ncbi:MAG: glutathione S-transferase family protein [Bdellovibrionales bacterium]|nr:glutathione S-transferase family protein [Bdellovibrionales bacterium]
MAALNNGNWSNEPIATPGANGSFLRQQSQFRDSITSEEAAPGRYHLYVSYACPWAHRTLIVRSLKKLENVISCSVTNARMGDKGWTFGSGHEVEYLANVYRGANPHYSGKVTVPVLWDYRKETIVNNESSEIIRMLNSAFNAHSQSTIDLFPEPLQPEIEKINKKIYHKVNNGVYKTGFAASQMAYEKSFLELFETLDEMDKLLGQQKYLTGDKITEADIRFFTTLVRFDVVYYVHFKCNYKLIAQYENLYPYLRSLYQIPEIKSTCHFDHIKEHYYRSHKFINPSKLVPLGPLMELDAPHNRGAADFFSSVRTSHLS